MKNDTKPESVAFVQCYKTMVKTYGNALGDETVLSFLKEEQDGGGDHLLLLKKKNALDSLEMLADGRPEWTSLKTSLQKIIVRYWM